MIKTAISKLLEHGCHEEALSYYKMISKFYAKAENHEQALVYSGQVLTMAEHLLTSRVERGL